MAERRARLVAIEPDGLVFEVEEDRCRDCSIGCAGRCNLFVTDADRRLRLAFPSRNRSMSAAPSPAACSAGDSAGDDRVPPFGLSVGADVLIELDEARLRQAGYHGYGLALLALLLGAAAGAGSAALAAGLGLKVDPDVPTLIGMVFALAIAIRRARGREPQPTVRPVGFPTDC